MKNLTKTERKQLRKAKIQAAQEKRLRIVHITTAGTIRGRWLSQYKRVNQRLHFLIKEGRGAFWFRKLGLPNPTAENVREDLKELKSWILNAPNLS